MNALQKTETPTRPRFAMSVDVEDYFQVWAFSDVIKRGSWEGFEYRAGEATRRCLDLFDRHDVKATFFTLGWIAERDANLVREIVACGHELASHGYDHTKADQQDRAAFLDDVSHTKKLLEDISGAAVKGYRAAGFSIGPSTPWAHEALAEAGYVYSSSAHPIAHDHYGDAEGEQNPYMPLKNAGFIEAPVATATLLGRRVSCAGGGWFRAMPLPLSTRLLRQAEGALKGPVIFYFHPWEIDPGQPRINSASLRSKLRHYLNLGGMEKKLSRALGAFAWGRVDEALGFSGTGDTA